MEIDIQIEEHGRVVAAIHVDRSAGSEHSRIGEVDVEDTPFHVSTSEKSEAA